MPCSMPLNARSRSQIRIPTLYSELTHSPVVAHSSLPCAQRLIVCKSESSGEGNSCFSRCLAPFRAPEIASIQSEGFDELATAVARREDRGSPASGRGASHRSAASRPPGRQLTRGCRRCTMRQSHDAGKLTEALIVALCRPRTTTAPLRRRKPGPSQAWLATLKHRIEREPET